MEQEMGLSLYFPPGPTACPEDIKVRGIFALPFPSALSADN